MEVKKEIPALTGVRFIAVLFVFLFHYFKKDILTGNFFQQLLQGAVNHFHIGVSIFFVLSGFLICYNYYEKTELKKSFYLRFYAKRFIRIYPLFFLIVTATFLWATVRSRNEEFSGVDYLMHITLLKGVFQSYYLRGIGQTWSLTTEETFYLLAPLIFYIIRIKKIFYGQIVFYLVIGFLLTIIFNRINFYGFFGSYQFTAMVTFFGRCIEFFMGLKLALLIRDKKAQDRTFSSPTFTLAGILIVVISLVIMSLICKYAGVDNATETIEGILAHHILLPFGVVVFFFGLIKETSLIRSMLGSKLFILLGRSSYAFYLIHVGLFAGVCQKYVTQNLVLLFILIQLASIALYLIIEKPTTNFLRKKLVP